MDVPLGRKADSAETGAADSAEARGADTLEAPATKGVDRRAVRFILLVVFVDMLAASTAIPVLPRLLLGMLHGDSAAAAKLVGLFGTVFAAMQFLFGPLQGAISDRFGRKPVLVVSCLGLAGAQALNASATTPAMLLAARILSGVSAANVSTATAYLADILPASERAGTFGRVGAAFGAGLVLGPVLGGLLATHGIRFPFVASAVLAAANAAWALAILRESLPAGSRTPFRLSRAHPLGALLFLAEDRRVLGLAASGFLSMLAQQALISVFVLSATVRFGWGPIAVGAAMASIGLCYALVGAALVPQAVRLAGEVGALAIGLLFGVIGFLILAFAPNGFVFSLAVPVMSLWGLASPATQGAISRLVPSEAQGRLQGALTSIGGLAGIIGPTVFGTALALGLSARGTWHMPGLPFAIAAVFLVMAAPVAIGTIRRVAREVPLAR